MNHSRRRTTHHRSSSSTFNIDDADKGAGTLSASAAPSSLNSFATLNTNKASDLDFFEDLISEPVLVLGFDISHLSRRAQFMVCAVGVFFFSLLYGYLQELLSVTLCSRKLGLFLAMMQFSGYTLLAFVMRGFVDQKQKRIAASRRSSSHTGTETEEYKPNHYQIPVPLNMYLGLSFLRAIDLGMTNLAMQYINYPAKTLMKSSRIVFTMLFGVILARKKYAVVDYFIVLAMVLGLALFMHADANSSAVFSHLGVIMLSISLTCDGAISNMSENIMSRYGVGQDEFIFRMYSIALVAISAAAAIKGDLREGLIWLSQPGTYDQLSLPVEERQYSAPAKILIMVLFSTMGFFGSSCSAAITKNFGALTMSITSTARKATTLFLSFFLFKNVCTWEHLLGVSIFISALTTKSLRRGRKDKGSKDTRKLRERNVNRKISGLSADDDVEMRTAFVPSPQARNSTMSHRKQSTSGDLSSSPDNARGMYIV